MNQVRPMAVAGQFYPNNVVELEQMLTRCFSGAVANSIQSFPKALIAPHAGYIYSGPIAGSVYKTVMTSNEHVKRILLLGPSHRVAFIGIATCGADYYASPLGTVKIDKSSEQQLADLPYVGVLPEAHAYEHSLEVQIPFMQKVLPGRELIPLVVGQADAQQVASVIERLLDEDLLVVVSSDLSHYLDYASAKKRDANTTQAIEALTSSPLVGEQACGCRPINGLLKVAREQAWQVNTLDLRNSGDTVGNKDRVVGYGAYVFT